MSSIEIVDISDLEVKRVLAVEEGHFADLKAIDIQPAKLTRTIGAFSNAEGGELYIGIAETPKRKQRRWRGFKNVEAANGHIQAFEALFPLGQDYAYQFLRSPDQDGLVLKADVRKTRNIKEASNGKVYVRRGAQNLPVEDPAQLEILRRNKGITSFETETVNADLPEITNSSHIISFVLDVVPNSEPEPWLKKQRLIVSGKPTVAGVVLFAEEPQALLPKRCGIKISRYKTTDAEGSRESMAFNPISIEGCGYEQIYAAVRKTSQIIESVRVSTPTGLEKASYPPTALHEIITNAVLHRDYSVADDIHIRIFDNRVEVLGVSHSINGNTRKPATVLRLLVLRQLGGKDEPIGGRSLVSAHT